MKIKYRLVLGVIYIFCSQINLLLIVLIPKMFVPRVSRMFISDVLLPAIPLPEVFGLGIFFLL